MIIWLASYPKSGNTWLRSLLSYYLYAEEENFKFSLLNNIKQFPSRKYLEYFLNDFSNEKRVSEFWIAAQDKINLYNDKPIFMKTHSALCTLENNAFTNKENTMAAIYIVRDPRNLITSLSNHYSMSANEACNFLTDKNKIISLSERGAEDFGIATVLGSWSDHFKSWKNLKFAPVLIIKYEDLLKDTEKSFIEIINFLSNLIDIKIIKDKLKNTIANCTFEKLSELESKEGFIEAVSSKGNNQKKKFFYLGKKNNWKKLLNPEIEKKLRLSFSHEMKELGYI